MIFFRTLILLSLFAIPAQSQVLAPCGAAPKPAFAKPGAEPAYAILDGTAAAQWAVPGCTGWQAGSRSKLVVGIAGSFRFDGTIDDLLARAGAISQLPKILYWSQSHTAWQPVAVSASALRNSDAKSSREDFSPRELVAGSEHYFREEDSRAGNVVFKVTMRERDADRAVFTRTNCTAISAYIFSSDPGSSQTTVFLMRISPGIWGIYILDRVGEGTSRILPIPQQSITNRDVAYFRYLAGIPTDRDPAPFH